MAQEHFNGNMRLRQAWPKAEANFTELYNRTKPASEEEAGLMSAEDKEKLEGIEEGAEVNQNAYSFVEIEGQPVISADGKTATLKLKNGTGITLTTNPITGEVQVTATGDSTPGPHGEEHAQFGSDPLPLATTTDGGLMSAEDKQAMEALEGLPQEVTELKADFASTESKTYYVDAVDGDDNNDGSSAATAFKTWAKVLSVIPRFIQHDYTIRIIGHLPENLNFYDRIIGNNKRVTIIGDTENGENHEITQGLFDGLSGLVFVEHVTFTGRVYTIASNYVRFSTVRFRNEGGVGIEVVRGALADVRFSDFGENICMIAIQTDNSSMCVSRDNTGTVTGTALNAIESIITRRGTQPTGANDVRVNSGIIGSTTGVVLGYSGAFVCNTAGVSIPNEEVTAITFDTVRRQQNYRFWNPANPTRLTVPVGITRVRLVAQVGWTHNANGRRQIHIAKNGGFLNEPRAMATANAIETTAASISTPLQIVVNEIQVVAGDYFELMAWQNSGGSLNVAFTGNVTYLNIEAIE